MSAVAHFAGLAETTLRGKAVHLAIGMFDGVHIGHCAVIESAVQSARRSGALAGVLTFWPHPSALFRPTERTRMITSAAERLRLLAETGVDFVITEPFTPELAGIEATAFLPHLRRHLPRLQTIYVGENWRFGRGRVGDVSLLIKQARAEGLSVVSAQRINFNGEPVSSTRIRAALEAGAIEDANALLGYAYTADGVVTPGKQLGRTLGFPTLNLLWTPDLSPRFGVYATRVIDPLSGQSRDGVANYGLRPTVESTVAPKLEVHVLGDCPWSAGAPLRVEWHAFLRPEMRFVDLAALTAQIGQDRAAAEAYFRAKNNS